jgi:hypothetical protein
MAVAEEVDEDAEEGDTAAVGTGGGGLVAADGEVDLD